MSSHPTQTPRSQNSPSLQSEGTSQAAPSVAVDPVPEDDPVDPSSKVGSVIPDPLLVGAVVVLPGGTAVSPTVPPSVVDIGDSSVLASCVTVGEKQPLSETARHNLAKGGANSGRRIGGGS